MTIDDVKKDLEEQTKAIQNEEYHWESVKERKELIDKQRNLMGVDVDKDEAKVSYSYYASELLNVLEEKNVLEDRIKELEKEVEIRKEEAIGWRKACLEAREMLRISNEDANFFCDYAENIRGMADVLFNRVKEVEKRGK